MSETVVDLCAVLVSEMAKIELSDTAKSKITNNRFFLTSVGQIPAVQKTYLTLAFSNVLNGGSEVVPPQIRLGLNMAGEVQDWLMDIKLIVLPFIKANQDKLFV